MGISSLPPSIDQTPITPRARVLHAHAGDVANASLRFPHPRQLRHQRRSRGRVPYIAQDAACDFPVPRPEWTGTFQTWHGEVLPFILSDVGNASLQVTAASQLHHPSELPWQMRRRGGTRMRASVTCFPGVRMNE